MNIASPMIWISLPLPRPESYFRRGLEEELHKAYEANQPVDFLEITTKRSLKTALS